MLIRFQAQLDHKPDNLLLERFETLSKLKVLGRDPQNAAPIFERTVGVLMHSIQLRLRRKHRVLISYVGVRSSTMKVMLRKRLCVV